MMGRVVGRALVSARAFGVRPADDVPGVTAAWLRVLRALRCRFEVSEVSEDRVVVNMFACPAGLSVRDGRRACHAGMEADRRIVERLGGELIIGETIATGAPTCTLTVVAKKH